MAQHEDMLKNMMIRFDTSDQNVKEMRGYLAKIRQKVDEDAVLIMLLQLQMAQLYSIVNPCQPFTLLRNTINNLKNDGSFMEATTRGGMQTIDHQCRLYYR